MNYQITIRAARITAGLTIEQAAKSLGMSVQTLSKHEQYSGKLKCKQVVAMSKLYSVPLDVLYFGKESDCAEHNQRLMEAWLSRAKGCHAAM